MCCVMNISCPPLITYFLRKWRISCPFLPINLLEHEDNFVTTSFSYTHMCVSVHVCICKCGLKFLFIFTRSKNHASEK